MPEIPRDPRQLARDILAGKVRIEDLARQRLGGVATARPAPGQARVPDKIPLPRPAALRPAPAVQRLPQPVRTQPVRPTLARPVPARPVPARTMPPPRPAPPPVQRRPQAAAPVLSYTVLPPAVAPVAAVVQPAAASVQKDVAVGAILLGKELGKDALRQGVLLAEILGKPVALRE